MWPTTSPLSSLEASLEDGGGFTSNLAPRTSADGLNGKSASDPRGFTSTQKSLAAMGSLNLLYFFVQIVVAARSKSLSMLSDAFHNLSDVAAAFVALYADRVHGQRRDPGARLPFGMARAQVLGAGVNAVCLVCLCFYLVLSATPRLLAATAADEIDASDAFVGTAVAGIVINGFTAGLLIFGGRDESGANIHAHAHVTGFCRDCGPAIMDAADLTEEELVTPFSFVKKQPKPKPPPPPPPPPSLPPPPPPMANMPVEGGGGLFRAPWASPALWPVVVHALGDAGTSFLGTWCPLFLRITLATKHPLELNVLPVPHRAHHAHTTPAPRPRHAHTAPTPPTPRPRHAHGTVLMVGLIVRGYGAGNDVGKGGEKDGVSWTAYLDPAVTVFLSVFMVSAVYGGQGCQRARPHFVRAPPPPPLPRPPLSLPTVVTLLSIFQSLSMRGVIMRSAHVLLEGTIATDENDRLLDEIRRTPGVHSVDRLVVTDLDFDGTARRAEVVVVGNSATNSGGERGSGAAAGDRDVRVRVGTGDLRAGVRRALARFGVRPEWATVEVAESNAGS